MKKTFYLSALMFAGLLFAGNAAATCQYGGNYPNCNPKPTCPYGGTHPNCNPKPTDPPGGNNTNTNTNTNTNNNLFSSNWWQNTSNSNRNTNTSTSTSNATGGAGGHGGAGGQGGAGGSVAGSGNSSNTNTANGGSVGNTSSNSGGNTMTGGANTNTTHASNSNDGSGNSNVSVDAADRSSHSSSYTDNTLFIPAVIPATPAANVGVGNVTTLVGVCGPLQSVTRERVIATYIGIVKRANFNQGFDETLAPYVDESGKQVEYRRVPQPDGSVKLYGHQPITSIAIIGVAASRNIALGGGGGAGDWGQAGAGSSSSIQQMVTRIQLRDCEVGSLTPPRPVYIEVPPAKQGG